MAVGDSPAKLTRDAKAMIQLAFEDLGGLPRLVEWANDPKNLGTFYTQLWSKIIPKDIKAEVDQSITIEVVKFGDDSYALRHGEDSISMDDSSHLEMRSHSKQLSIEDADYSEASRMDSNSTCSLADPILNEIIFGEDD